MELNEHYSKLELVSAAKMWNKLCGVGTTIFSGNYVKVTPYTAGSDGFFAAVLVDSQAAIVEHNG